MVGPTMNLISKTYHLCEMMEYAFMILWGVHNNFPKIWVLRLVLLEKLLINHFNFKKTINKLF